MVNYVYDMSEIEANHFALTELGTVAASKSVLSLIDDDQATDDKKGNRAA